MSTKRGGSKAPPSPIVEIGHIIGEKYRVEAVIGSGGMGVVVAARHIAMNSRVAIKILKLDDDVDPVEAIARFNREARAAARIQSEHVVRVTDVSALPDGMPYMVMEYLQGDDLRRVIQERNQLPIEEAVDYVIQACEGLAEAHAEGVIHRDLKPSNLFLSRRANGTSVLKVLDFGISKVAPRADEVAMTTTNSLMGSPLYMAPEQMKSSRTVDARADIWSLGLILYELLTGDLPFGGETIPEICVAVMNDDPAPLSHYRRDVPQELQAILLKCIAKKRDDRYATTAALARDLAKFSSVRGQVHAERASAAMKAERSAMPTLPERPAPSATTTQKKVQGPAVAEPASPGSPQLEERLGPEPRPDPETQPSWAGHREKQARRKRSAWVAIGGLVALVAAIGAGILARTSASGPAVQGSAAPPSTTTERVTASTEPASKGDLASVPFDSLPAATHDAGPARASPPHRPSSPAPATAAPAPVPAPSAGANHPPKDDWKWGDRN